MNCVDPEFKLPEVAFAAGISASNLSNWYDREQVESFCDTKDGWKRYNAFDVMHVTLVRELMKNGVPIPGANELSARLFREMRKSKAVERMHPIAYPDIYENNMFIVAPTATGGYLTRHYFLPDHHPPYIDGAFVTVPLGLVWRRAISRAMTGDKSAQVQLTFEKDSDRIAHAILKKTIRDAATEHVAGPAYTDPDRDDDLAEASAVITDVTARLRELEKNPSLATKEELQDMLLRALKAEQLVREDFE